MRIAEIIHGLAEGITVHSEGLLAYVLTVGESYADASEFDRRAAPSYSALAGYLEGANRQLQSKVDVRTTPGEPYEVNPDRPEVSQRGHAAMVNDVRRGRLDVWSGENSHPFFNGEQNTAFRAVHDYYGHVLPRLRGGSSHSFTIRGEFNTYLTQARLVPKAAVPALFTEILGQACYYFAADGFGPQKVAVLAGFDYTRLGRCEGAQQHRMSQLLAEIRDPRQRVIQTRLRPIERSQINWSLLAPSGAPQAT